MAIGRWIVTHQAIPDICRFYYSAATGFGYDYSWFSQAILFSAYRLLGGAGIALLTSVVAGAVFYFLYKLLERQGKNLLANFVVLGLALMTITVYLSGRPMMFTVVFLTLEVFVLSGFVRARNRLIWLIPPMVALWVNLHPGFVVAPLVILAFLPLARETRDRWALVGCLAATGVAVMLNPYGWRIYLMPLEIARSLPMLKGLSEWRSVSSWQTVIWGSLVALVTCGLSLRRQPVPVILLVALSAFAAGMSTRNMPLFGVIMVFVVGRTLLPVLSPALERLRFVRRFDADFEAAGGWFWAIAVPLLLVGAVRLQVFPMDLSFDFSGYPAAAVRHVQDNDCPDNVFVRETWSGYLLWAMPNRRLFYDAKGGFSREAVAGHSELVRPRATWRDAAERNGVSTFLLERGSPLAVTLREADDWRLEYSDSLAEVFVRGSATPAREVSLSFRASHPPGADGGRVRGSAESVPDDDVRPGSSR